MFYHLIAVVCLLQYAVFLQSHAAYDVDQEEDVQLSHKAMKECLQNCSNVSPALSNVKLSNGWSCFQKCLRRKRMATFHRNGRKRSFFRRMKRDVSNNHAEKCCPGKQMTCNDTEILRPTGLKVTFHEINNTGTFYAKLSWDPLQNNTVEWKGYQLEYIVAGFEDHEFEQKCKQFGKNVTQYIVEYPGMANHWEFHMVVTSYPFATDPQTSSHFTRCRVPENCPRTAFHTSPTPATTAASTTAFHTSPTPDNTTTSTSDSTTSPTTPANGPEQFYTPSSSKDSKGVTIIIVSACAIAIASLGLLFWNYRRSKKNAFSGYGIKTNEGEYIAKYRHKPLHFEYDAFIIYSTKDQEWVTTTLLPTLEQKHGLKCCIHYRNFAPGVLYRENMVNSVYKSRKTVAVVSPNFFSSGFCESEFEYALRRLTEWRDDSLIVIKLDDIDEEKFPMELKQRSYIDCPKSVEKETWEEKLVHSLKVY